MRIKEMVAYYVALDYQTNSPCQYLKKHEEKSVENNFGYQCLGVNDEHSYTD